MTLEELRAQHCQPRKGAADALGTAEVDRQLTLLAGWANDPAHGAIAKEFRFKNFYRTMAFVNAIAWIANNQDHHPDLEVGYGRCLVRFSTHDVGGLSQNDFICAAKVEGLFAEA